MPALADALTSDRVVVLEADGRTHTVQHTLFSEGPLATLTLPGSVVPQRVAFGGPERLTFRQAWEANPERLAVYSGSAFARYRHQYGDEVRSLPGDGWRLSVWSIPSELSIAAVPRSSTGGKAGGGAGETTDDADAARIAVSSTWVFPSDVDVLDWQADGTGDGQWTFEDNSLGWQQTGSEPVALTITYRTRTHTAPLADSLLGSDGEGLATDNPYEPNDVPPDEAPESAEIAGTVGTSESVESAGPREPTRALEPAGTIEAFEPIELAELPQPEGPSDPSDPSDPGGPGGPGGPDEDGDGVVDTRDVCLGRAQAALPPPWGGASEQVLESIPPLPGCGEERRVVLEGIGFDVGKSVLDASARRALDRVAAALGAQPGQAYEIAAHTDNQGLWRNNLALSARRARAVRQYLLLRGVAAERLSATGHGESRPLVSNDTVPGRRQNRRIELGPLPPGAPDDSRPDDANP